MTATGVGPNQGPSGFGVVSLLEQELVFRVKDKNREGPMEGGMGRGDDPCR